MKTHPAFLTAALLLAASPAFAADLPTIHLTFGKSANTSAYSFADPAAVTTTDTAIQAPHFFRLDTPLPDGSYDITATLGNPTTETTTTIRSEEHRLQIADAHTNPNEFRDVSFTVNIHKDVANKTELNSDGKLHLEFIGTNPSLTKLDIKPNTTAPVIYLVGDSTCCDYNVDPRFGWGQMLPVFFKPGEVVVNNMAKSGRTAKSFMAEKRLDDILNVIKPGDYMFIQFAHNDMKDTTLTPEIWKSQLLNFVDGARQHNAFPVMVTSMPRRQFGPDNKIKNSLGDFPQTTRDFAKEQKIPLLDLNARATELFDILGPDGTTKAFCYYPAGLYIPPFDTDHTDNTHFNPYGAYELAKIIAHEIKTNNLPLAPHLVDNLEPQNPEPAKFPPNLAFNPLLAKK